MGCAEAQRLGPAGRYVVIDDRYDIAPAAAAAVVYGGDETAPSAPRDKLPPFRDSIRDGIASSNHPCLPNVTVAIRS